MSQVGENQPRFQRERYLAALIEVQRQLLATKEGSSCPTILKILGEASGASRVYMMENEFVPDRLIVSRRAEWCAPGIRSLLNHPALQQEPIEESFPSWVPFLRRGNPISALTADLPDRERRLLEGWDVKALLNLPIVAKGEFLGWLGLDNCVDARLWQPAEIEILQSAAAAVLLWFERERTAKALQQSEVLLRSVFQNSPISIGLTTLDGMNIANNPASSRMLGYTPDELKTLPFRDYTHPDDIEMDVALYEELLAGKRDSYQIEKRYVRKDQQIVWVRLTTSAIKDHWGNILYAFAMSEDITEQKLAEAALRERMRLSALTAAIGTALAEGNTLRGILGCCAETLVQHLDAAFVRIWTLDAQAQVLKLQASAGRYTHLDGKHSRIRVGQYKIGRVAQSRQPYLTNDVLGDPFIHDKAWAQQEGMVAFAGYPLIAEERVVGVMAIFAQHPLPETALQEVGSIANQIALGIERKQGEEALKQALEAAKVADRAKSQFLSHMSHELRTPLNVILGFAQLLARSTPLDPQQQGYIDTISRSGEHLLALINDVLEMSKIEAGQIALNASNFDLHQLLNWLHEMLSLKAQHLRLQIEWTADLPRYVRTDKGKLLQVLMNLLSNAIKFTPTGHVILRVTQAPFDRRDRPAIALHFAVEDTGIGIAPENLERLFEPFVHAADAPEGTGLGLAISQRFVQLMGGKITVSSRVGQGSMFRFSIPVEPVAPHQVQSHPPGQQVVGIAPGQPAYRLLVVEDQENNRQFLVELLTSVGFEVREATNGEAAIALCQRWQPHLIWMDIRMPGMNGYEATRWIKSGSSPPIIIALTGSAFEEDRLAALAMGCDDFVRKPVPADTIFEKLTEHLGVQYVHEDRSDRKLSTLSRRSCAGVLVPRDLAVMPKAWRQQLHQAATRVNAKQQLSLIQQIPEAHVQLAEALARLINNFCFEEIILLTQESDDA